MGRRPPRRLPVAPAHRIARFADRTAGRGSRGGRSACQILLAGSLRYGDASDNAEVHVRAGMSHVFTSQLGVLRAADQALAELAASCAAT